MVSEMPLINRDKKMLHRTNKFQSQRGYTLVELSIVLVIIAMVIMLRIFMDVEEARNDKVRAVAQTYQRLNNAMGSYLTNYYDKLVTLKPECSIAPWTSDYPVTASKAPSVLPDCELSLSLNGRKPVTVVNGLQPTLLELTSLGLIEGAGISNGLPLPTVTASKGTLSNVVLGNWYMGGKTAPLPPKFLTIVEFICINGGGRFTVTGGCIDASTGKDTAFDLRSLVFNSQPFDLDRSGGNQFLHKMLQIAGADAFLSTRVSGTSADAGAAKVDNGELWAMSGAAEAVIHNPMRHVPTDMGVPHIFAMRNGYGSAGWDRFVRRDGATPMTGNWDYGNSSVNNINNITTNNSVTVGNVDPNLANGTGGTGTLNVNGIANVGTDASAKSGSTVLNVKGNAIITGDSTVTGLLTAIKAIFNDLKVKTAEFTGAVNFRGGIITDQNSPSTFNGNITTDSKSIATFKGPTSFYRFSLAGEAKLGDVCSPGSETITKQSVDAGGPYSKGLRLLVCDVATSKWVQPQNDLQTQVDNMKTTITNGLATTSQEILYDGEKNYTDGKPLNTGISCAEWSRPVVSSLNTGDYNAVGQIVFNSWCDAQSQKWFVSSQHPKSWTKSVWLTFKQQGTSGSGVGTSIGGIFGEWVEVTYDLRYITKPRAWILFKYIGQAHFNSWDVRITSVRDAMGRTYDGDVNATWIPQDYDFAYPTLSFKFADAALNYDAFVTVRWTAKVAKPMAAVPMLLPASGVTCDDVFSLGTVGTGDFWSAQGMIFSGTPDGSLTYSYKQTPSCTTVNQSSNFSITWK